jgi:uncharacterized membrane protein
MTVSVDPIWPWSQLLSGESEGGFVGWVLSRGLSLLLIVVPAALVALSAWTYFVSGQPRRRVLAVLGLRLLAFLLAAAAILRPSLGFADRHAQRGLLLVALDASESMTILDEINGQSRWAYLQKLLKESGDSVRKLQDDQNVDVVFYRFAGDTSAVQPDDLGQADGKRTEIGAMLRSLYEGRDGQRRPVGLLVLSDGADNGKVPSLTEAARWRQVPCPVHTFAFGKTTTSDRRSDIAVTAITSQPAVVPIKSLFTVNVTVDAPGFENRSVTAKLFIDDKEVKAQPETLRLTLGNQIRLTTNAPDKAGEIKVTVRVGDSLGRPLEGEISGTNNEISTFVTVSKEGLRVLLVDKPRAGEPQSISDALSRDPRIRVTNVWLRGDTAVDADTAALLDCDKNPYDVIMMGDVTAQQLSAANKRAMEKMREHVAKGAGFVMLGGYNSFDKRNWGGTPIEQLLPVELTERGQVDGRSVQMQPTRAGIDRYGYILRLTDQAKDLEKVWGELKPLEGMALLGKPKAGLGDALATAKVDGKDEPILVTKNYDQGRVLAFGGDTTHRWVRGPETLAMQRRFWQRMAIWLAKQDEAEGSVWVRPDVRRLPIRGDLGFTVGMKSKTGAPVTNGVYKAEVVAPDGSRTPVSTARTGTEQRGTFTKADVPGEYRIYVSGQGKDDSGEDVQGEATVRFLVYDEEVEMLRRAADHEFLRKLATAGGGKFHQADELPGFLRELQSQPDARWRPKVNLWPNWRTTGTSPFLGFFFVLFVVVVSGEWYLRRRWGMV